MAPGFRILVLWETRNRIGVALQDKATLYYVARVALFLKPISLSAYWILMKLQMYQALTCNS